jgi:two-component system response regulator NreC
MVSKSFTVAVRGQSHIDQEALKALVTTLPGMVVVAETASPPPQVLLWDPEPGNGAAIPDHAPETALLALVKDSEPASLPPPGVAGLFAKNGTAAALGEAIRQVSRGQQYLSPELVMALIQQQQDEEAGDVDLDQLSRREREILLLLTEGLGNKAIAARLYLSVRTVEGHLARLYAKLDVHSRTEAALMALRSDLQQRRWADAAL